MLADLTDDDLIAQADALLSGASSKPWAPPSIDDEINWGKHKGRGTYRELARKDPSYTKWAASNIGGLKGQLCAEALAAHLGVDER